VWLLVLVAARMTDAALGPVRCSRCHEFDSIPGYGFDRYESQPNGGVMTEFSAVFCLLMIALITWLSCSPRDKPTELDARIWDADPEKRATNLKKAKELHAKGQWR
jgi:hypothetical protein